MKALISPGRSTLCCPQEEIRVLLLENIHPSAADAFVSEHYQVEFAGGRLTEGELIRRLPDVNVLGIRSATKLSWPVLEAGRQLLAVGAFCIGTNQIDLAAATGNGTAVFNAPFSNTRSVAELALGEIFMLLRHTFQRSTEMHAGIWKKTAVGSHEMRGRTLGVIGYGNIGSQLSVLAEALGMEVMFYDIADKLAFGKARRAHSLAELLSACDVITVHVDGRPENRGLIGAEEFAAMRDGAMFLNLSRGFVVDDRALADVLRSGKLVGAAVDVFPDEPSSQQPFESPLRGLPNVILTPHVASGTQEAQESIGKFVSAKLISFIKTGSTDLAVNLPNLNLPQREGLHRLVHVHQNRPGVLANINAIVAASGANIAGQSLGTSQHAGYVITDIEREYTPDVLSQLAKLPGTIRVRMLY